MGERAENKARVRRRVLDIASRAVREHGADGVSVAEVMRAAGLTHGTFYSHFGSKNELVAEAVRHAADGYREALRTEATARLSEAERGDADARARALAETYLSTEHLEGRADGCFIAALGPELSRDRGPIGNAFSDSVDAGIGMLETLLGETNAKGGTSADGATRDRAVSSLATAVGGMILARAARDESSAEAVLRACREALATRRGRS